MQDPSISVLFVCLGNICRSPLAEGYFRHLVEDQGLSAYFRIDSAGTGGWHSGESPDPRSIKVASENGVDITNQRSRVLIPDDLEVFDYIFGMDKSNVVNIKKRSPNHHHKNIHLFLKLSEGPDADVPDPYYDRAEGFRHVWDLVVAGSQHWLSRIRQDHSDSVFKDA